MSNFKIKINQLLNSSTRKNKVFCIGLHKTGTTTLADYFKKYGFEATHTVDWQNNHNKLEQFEFFSDGGSHFDSINEFDFKQLAETYPNSKFILQTRDTEKWVISKLKHAGWNETTEIQPDDIEKIKHDDWTYKSLLTVKKFIEHKFNYERKVKDFFETHAPNRLLVIDVTNKEMQANELNRLKTFLKLKSIGGVQLPHSNKRIASASISDQLKDFVHQEVAKYNSQA